MKKIEKKQRFALTLLFSFVVFCLIAITMIIAIGAVYLLIYTDTISTQQAYSPDIPHLLLFITLLSIFVGFIVSMAASEIPLGPVNKMIDGINNLAAGNFRVRLKFGWPITNHPAFAKLSDSFNKMAEDLEHTEMLRSDFINNFSHEFKTPIVSIAGFAKLLKRSNLTEAQRAEYLNVIEEESMRLSQMATNVLNLTKVENQSILTDVSRYNLSEQLRSCILLLESKWSRKSLEPELELDEYMIEANEELMKQVWINLLDNAVKFSPPCGIVRVDVKRQNHFLMVSITNSGADIPEEKLDKIFNKFYQADESHSSEGNGVGLAIVSRVVQLHSGSVSVNSKNSCTTFTVQLPDL